MAVFDTVGGGLRERINEPLRMSCQHYSVNKEDRDSHLGQYHIPAGTYGYRGIIIRQRRLFSWEV